jgi:hypothetical protein
MLAGAVEFFKRSHGESAPIKWTIISSFVSTRSDRQCRTRWLENTSESNTNVVRGPLSTTETARLSELVDEYHISATIDGHSLPAEFQKNRKRGTIPWSYIAKTFFPNRTAVSLRNEYEKIQRERQNLRKRRRSVVDLFDVHQAETLLAKRKINNH